MSWELLKGLTLVPHGAQLTGVTAALNGAGVIVSEHPSPTARVIHLVPYESSLAVITNPDAAPTSWLSYPLNPTWLLTAIRTAVELQYAQRAMDESAALLEVCRTMGSQTDPNALHRLIVRKARELTNADAGSLYLLDQADGNRVLRFAVTQTGPRDEEKYTGSVLTLSMESIAGSVAMTGEPIRVRDAYSELPADRVHFDASFDRATGYHTKSVLCVPVRNYHEEIVGVLQIINRKPSFDAVLSPALIEQLVMPFDEHDQEILSALAGQAGVVLENSLPGA